MSRHFSIAELTRSTTALRLGIDNTPTPEITAELERLAETLLEPVRDLLGVPVRVTSGYRCKALNTAVGSTAKNSAHMEGRAGDIEPIGMDLIEAFDKIRLSNLPYDQIIQECGPTGWIHIAIAAPGQTPRRQALTATGGPGHWQYAPVAA